MDKLDPEISAALRADLCSKPPPPPGGVTIEYARQRVHTVFGALEKYYGERLPKGDILNAAECSLCIRLTRFLMADSAYVVVEKRVPVDGGEIPVRIVRPTSEDGNATFPVLVWYHGGGVYTRIFLQDGSLVRSHGSNLTQRGPSETSNQMTVTYAPSAWICNLQSSTWIIGSCSTCYHLPVPDSNPNRLAPEYPFPTPFNDCFAALKWGSKSGCVFISTTKLTMCVGWRLSTTPQTFVSLSTRAS